MIVDVLNYDNVLPTRSVVVASVLMVIIRKKTVLKL